METHQHQQVEEGDASEAPTDFAEDCVELSLIDRGFESLPEAVARLIHVRTMILHENLLSTLPDSLSAFTNMEDLNLSRNKFSRGPCCIAFMKNLKRLTFDHNQLSMLPDSYVSLLALTRLDLRSNKLKCLPKCVSAMTNLHEIFLYENTMPDLPHWITSMKKLKDLRLEFNGKSSFSMAPIGIRSLPCARSHEKHLHANNTQSQTIKMLQNSLDVTNNELFSIDEFIPILPEYTYLDLGNNKLSSLPDSFSTLSHLNGLSLHNNTFSNIPTCISCLTNLTRLDISKNRIGYYDEWISRLIKLSVFEFTKMHEIPIRGPEGMTTLPCWRNTGDMGRIQRYNHPPYHSGEDLKNVDHLLELWKPYAFLNLSDNLLSSLPPAFAQQSQLQSLNISHNNFYTFPSVLSSLTGLTNLCVVGNPAYEIPQWITKLSLLRTLQISATSDGRVNTRNHDIPANDRSNSVGPYIIFAPSGLSKLPCWKQTSLEFGNLSALTVYEYTDPDEASLERPQVN